MFVVIIYAILVDYCNLFTPIRQSCFIGTAVDRSKSLSGMSIPNNIEPNRVHIFRGVIYTQIKRMYPIMYNLHML